MTPRAATAAAGAAAPTRGVAAPARPALRPVAPKRENTTTRVAAAPSKARRFNPVGVAVGLVVASLLAVVVGNMVLASGSLTLDHAQTTLGYAEQAYEAQLAAVTHMESPAVVAQSALGLHLVQPSETLQLPSVSLVRRLGPPVFSGAPCCSLTPGR